MHVYLFLYESLYKYMEYIAVLLPFLLKRLNI